MHYDVVIMGSGIAGGFLARHLRRELPELSVLVLEASLAMTDYKVGESSVEVAANYMIRRLNLGTYLYQHQLPKNGLRFFFDSPEKDLPLSKMSEIGSDHMPFHPSFQLERAALERDLVAMNRTSGARVELGAKVVELVVGHGAENHHVTYEQAGQRHAVTARWLCDASGRRHLLSRTLGQKVNKETRLNTASIWGRYRNVAGLDSVEDAVWRGRVRYTSRHLSTNHMMYDGYWIWFIPLAGDLMSVGVVYDKDRLESGPRTREEFEAFLQKHRSSRDLLEGAVFEDCQYYAHLPYSSERYFSTDRWAMTGFAGAFTDPFYSPGSDFIATANDFIVSMIRSEVSGDAASFAEKTEVYNAYYSLKYESVLRLYSKLYPIFGSFEVFRLKYLLDFANYYNLVVWPFKHDLHTDVAFLREELKFGELQLRAQSQMADHFVQLADRLRSRGDYFAENAGQWANGLNGVAHLEKRLDGPLNPHLRRQEVDRLYGRVFAALLEKASGAKDIADRACVRDDLGLPLVVAFKNIDDKSVDRLLGRVATKLTRDLKHEFPNDEIEKAVLRVQNGGETILDVVGPKLGSEEHLRITTRARELWDARASP